MEEKKYNDQLFYGFLSSFIFVLISFLLNSFLFLYLFSLLMISYFVFYIKRDENKKVCYMQ